MKKNRKIGKLRREKANLENNLDYAQNNLDCAEQEIEELKEENETLKAQLRSLMKVPANPAKKRRACEAADAYFNDGDYDPTVKYKK